MTSSASREPRPRSDAPRALALRLAPAPSPHYAAGLRPRLLLAPLLLLIGACASQPPPPPPAGDEPPAQAARPPRRPGAPGQSPGQRELDEAIKAARANDLATTLERCRAAIAKNPNLEHAYLLWGSTCAMKEDAGCEREAYETGLRALPRSVALHREMAFLELQSGRAAEAIGLYERARALSEDRDAELLSDLAYAYAVAGRAEDAKTLARRAVEQDARCFHCNMMLGEVLLGAGDGSGAASAYAAASRLDPASADARLGEAKARVVAGELERARELFAELVAKDPANPRLRAMAAQVAMKQKRPAEAIPHLLEVLKQQPDDRALLEYLLEAQKQAGDHAGVKETEKRLRALGGKR